MGAFLVFNEWMDKEFIELIIEFNNIKSTFLSSIFYYCATSVFRSSLITVTFTVPGYVSLF